MKGITIHDPLSGGKIMNESKWGHSSSTHRALGTVRRIIPSEAPYPCKSTVLDTTLPIRERCTLPFRHLRARRALEHDAVPIAHTQKVGLRLLQHHHDPYDVSGHKVLQQPSQQRYQRVHWGHWELAGRVATNGSEPSCRSRGLESPGSAHPPIRSHSLTSTSTQKSIDVRQDKMALAHGVSRTHSLPGALVKRRSSRSYHPGISTVYARHKEQEVGPCVETNSILKALERRRAQLSNQNQESSFSITSSASRSEVPYAYGQIRQEKVSVKRNIAKQLKSSSITFPKMSELLTHSKSTTKEVVSTNQQSSPYVLLMMSRAGTTFEAFRDALLSRSHDNNSCVNDWRESSFNATRTLAHARGRPPPRTNMLLLQNELKKIHIFLGEKLSTESLLEDILRPHVGVKYIVLDSGTCTQSRLITNYFVGTRQITLKDRLTMTLRKWNLEWMMPETYIITPRGFDNDDRFLLRDIMLSNNKVKPDVFWIVKSAHGSKGEGQRIFYSYSELVHYIDRQTFPNSWVAQRYISRPFLIHGRKFDIRVWVLVTCQGEYYVYEQGVLRTSSEYYSLSDLDNVLVHLTNHCIQERGPKYSMYEKGNEMSYEMFQQYLDQHHRIKTGVAFDFERDAMPLIRKIIYEVLKCMDQCFHAAPIPSSASMNRAQENKIHYVPYNKANVLPFQLFGFDFMLDYDFNVFLLEVNGSPAIADHLRDQMVEEMVAICVDPIFPPSTVRERVNFSFQRIEPQDKKT